MTELEEAIDGMRRGLTQARFYREKLYENCANEIVLRGGLKLRKTPMGYDFFSETFICLYDTAEDNGLMPYFEAHLDVADLTTFRYFVSCDPHADNGPFSGVHGSGDTMQEAVDDFFEKVDHDGLVGDVRRCELLLEKARDRVTVARRLSGR